MIKKLVWYLNEHAKSIGIMGWWIGVLCVTAGFLYGCISPVAVAQPSAPTRWQVANFNGAGSLVAVQDGDVTCYVALTQWNIPAGVSCVAHTGK